MIDVAINTAVKLAIDAGTACSDYQDRVLRNLTCKRVRVDECWAFCRPGVATERLSKPDS